MIKGVDVSKHQQDDVIKNLNENAQFVILRVAYGSNTDKKFHKFINEAIDKGLDIGIYVASYAHNIKTAQLEAEHCLKTIEEYRQYITLPIYFDFEYFSSDYIFETFRMRTTEKLVQDLTTAFCDTIIAGGYKTGFYTNLDFIKRYYTQGWIDKNKEYSFWYARPGIKTPDKVCDIWQYEVKPGVDFGYSGMLDKNILVNEALLKRTNKVELLYEGVCRLYIGFASVGDIMTLKNFLNSLKVVYKEKDGFITTGEVDVGIQKEIIMLATKLCIPIKVYNDDVKQLIIKKLYEIIDILNI